MREKWVEKSDVTRFSKSWIFPWKVQKRDNTLKICFLKPTASSHIKIKQFIVTSTRNVVLHKSLVKLIRESSAKMQGHGERWRYKRAWRRRTQVLPLNSHMPFVKILSQRHWVSGQWGEATQGYAGDWIDGYDVLKTALDSHKYLTNGRCYH